MNHLTRAKSVFEMEIEELRGVLSRVPDMLQKRNNVRFLLQRGLAAAGMFYGRVGRQIQVFMINGREYRTGRPGFHPFIDQETASPVQMPPVRQNDQMVQFDGRQDESLGVRLNLKVAFV